MAPPSGHQKGSELCQLGATRALGSRLMQEGDALSTPGNSPPSMTDLPWQHTGHSGPQPQRHPQSLLAGWAANLLHWVLGTMGSSAGRAAPASPVTWTQAVHNNNPEWEQRPQ